MNWLTLESIAEQLWDRMADASLRAIVLAALAGLLILFLRKRSAAQHALWTLVTLGMLVLPLLRPIIPPARVPISRPRALEAMRTTPEQELAVNPAGMLPPDSASAPIAAPTERSDTPVFRPSWILYTAILYIAGVLLFAVRLLLGLFLSRRLLRGAQSIAPDLGKFDVAPESATKKLKIEESERVRVPVTLGLKTMRIILPSDWRTWPDEKACVVLAHELAHVRRRDPLVALLAALNKCVFWFHPLAWWLERRLALLAEHAADDAGMKVARDAESYARTLLEVASNMQHGRRLIWSTPEIGSTAMSGPVIARRIRRVIDPRFACYAKRLGKMARVGLFTSAALLLWVAMAVDFRNVVHAQAEQWNLADNLPSGTMLGFLSDGLSLDPVTAKDMAKMEHQLAVNPEDEATRLKLIHYYYDDAVEHYRADSKEDRRLPLIFWLIDHHPESLAHGFASMEIDWSDEDNPNGNLAFDEARRHWLAQVEQRPQDAQVLHNAARVLAAKSTREEIDLMERAQKLEPARRTAPLAALYSMVLVSSTGNEKKWKKDLDLAAQIRGELQASNDIALVGRVTRNIVAAAASEPREPDEVLDAAAIQTIAAELVTRAQKLDPRGQHFSELMNEMDEPGAIGGTKGHWSDLMGKVRSIPDSTEWVRVAREVAAGNLVKTHPVTYSPGDKAAHQQGVVLLQVFINRDGHVTTVGAIGGHADFLMDYAAMEAVQGYIYKPFMFNGHAVNVQTTVEVAVGGKKGEEPSNPPAEPATSPLKANWRIWATTQNGNPAGQPQIKDPAEYSAYMTALNTQEPGERALALKAFVKQYPDSVMRKDALFQAEVADQQADSAAPPQLVRVSKEVAARSLIKSRKPIYPQIAKPARIQGEVTLQVRIGKDGHVTDVKVISGHPMLVQAAIDAVRQYVYKPYLLNGSTVEVTTEVDVPFETDQT